MREPQITLYRALACPYSHRVELVLAAKGIDAEFREIDLLDRPAWFQSMASNGRIPLIDVDGFAVPFGDRVNEYLDERFPAPPLSGATPEARALARQWVDWCTTTLGPTYEAALMNVDAEQSPRLLRRLDKVVAELETRLSEHRPDPYWHGPEPGLVDFTYASIFVRWAGMVRFHGWTVPASCPLVEAWRVALVEHPTVAAHTDLKGILAMLEHYRTFLSTLSQPSQPSPPSP